MSLSIEEIKNNLISQILYNFPTAQVDTGSVLRDIMVDPQSVQLAALSQEIDKTSYLNTFVQNAENITEQDLNEIGANYSISRNVGSFSTGIITFRSNTRPTQKIQIGADDGSGGITVKTLTTEDGQTYEFVTTETVYMNTDATYNEEHNCYEVSAPIIAKSLGSKYNVGIGTITVLDSAISSITGCYNYVAMSGGADEETQSSYASSIQNAILGSSKNIESGINNLLLKQQGVTEVKTLHPNSEEEPTQTGYAISYIKGSTESIYQNFTFTYTGTEFSFNLPQKPVTRIISVIATVNGEQKTLIAGTDYNLASDNKSIYANTIYANDRIELLKSASGTPDTGTDVIVNFAYNSLIQNCQDELNSNLQNYLVLGNLLVAQAVKSIIDLEITIKLKYSYNTEIVKNEILTGISNFVNSLKLGQDVSQEQFFTFLTTTYQEYISSIVFPFNVFKKRNDIANSTELYFNYGQYASIDENSLKINFE